MTKTYVEIIAWNTGRCYSKMGQRIAAGHTTEGDVYFADIDRGIFGKLKSTQSRAALNPTAVMRQYDTGDYTDDTTNETLMHCAGKIEAYIAN